VEGDNNYNSCGNVGKLQAERTIQYHTGRSGTLKKIYWFPSRRYAVVTSSYEIVGGPVLEQDCDYVAGQTDATKVFFILKSHMPPQYISKRILIYAPKKSTSTRADIHADGKRNYVQITDTE
jgi:hypothetical protein